MNNKNKAISPFIMVIFISAIGLISFAIVSYNTMKDNEALTAELNSNKEALENTKNELIVSQENLIAETEKVLELNDKLSVTQNELNGANEVIASRNEEIFAVDYEVTDYEINMIAKTVWGEARGCSKIQQSAVVWCILNRVDDGRGTIAQIITAPQQFHGYQSNFPVDEDIRALVIDVIARWKLEKITDADVGRTLPREYTYFHADGTGTGNVFKTNWGGNYETWNWDCWNPYE